MGEAPSYIQMPPAEGFRNRLVLFRPPVRQFRLVRSCIVFGLIAFALVSFYFLILRLALGLIVVAVVSWRSFLVWR